MSFNLNRRSWLKNVGLLGAGATVLPSLFQEAQANPVVRQELYNSLLSEFEHANHAFYTGKIRLNANENPHGPSEKAKKAVIDALPDSYMYAGKALEDFRKAIADKEGIKSENVLLGAGSSELLLASLISYGAKGSIMCGDTCYITGGRNERMPLDKVLLTKDYQYDLDAMKAKITDKTSLIYICNPNNPTGAILPADKLKAFIDEVSPKVTILVDEAYIDYAKDPKTESMMAKIIEGKNIIILRTFSKIHAFAGLRIGYAIGQPDTLKALMNYCTGGMNISYPSAKAALASYLDADFQKFTYERTNEAKSYLYDFLKKSGYAYIPSSTNFVLFPIKMKGEDFMKKMDAEGIMIRRWEFDKQHWCRVSIGTMEQMKSFTNAFTKITA
jgi:histidinol-phosphate aminotransferase